MLLLLLRPTREWPLRAPAPFQGWWKGPCRVEKEPGACLQLVFYCLWFLFTKGTQWVCREVDEIGVGFQQRSVTASKARMHKLVFCGMVYQPVHEKGNSNTVRACSSQTSKALRRKRLNVKGILIRSSCIKNLPGSKLTQLFLMFVLTPCQ